MNHYSWERRVLSEQSKQQGQKMSGPGAQEMSYPGAQEMGDPGAQEMSYPGAQEMGDPGAQERRSQSGSWHVNNLSTVNYFQLLFPAAYIQYDG